MSEEIQAILALEDGTLFHGHSLSYHKRVVGELIFNTSMTGYQEVCTDPSYAGQIVLFTASHIGNAGINRKDYESNKPWLKGLIAREISKIASNWRSEESFISFLHRNNIPWIEGIDTRKLTRHIRNHGTKKACIMIGAINTKRAISLAQTALSPAIAHNSYTPKNLLLRKEVPRIIIYDFGVKSNIIQTVLDFGCAVHHIPHTISADELLSYKPDGIILSNGPGDPSSMPEKLQNIKKLIFSGIPILGICLGCQLIALAAGGKTKKMAFGHHGINHPIYDIKNNKVLITSQNHNFAVDSLQLPSCIEITHRSLFDNSIEGIRIKNYPTQGFQAHPEGSPGPQHPLLKEFIQEIVACH